MRLTKVRAYVQQKGWKHTYHEDGGLGSLDFEARGLRYHVWEFLDGEYGAESNVRLTSRQEDYFADYEQQILDILNTWQE